MIPQPSEKDSANNVPDSNLENTTSENGESQNYAHELSSHSRVSWQATPENFQMKHSKKVSSSM